MKEYIIGIDVGGTNVKLGVVRNDGRIILRNNLATKSFVRNKQRLIRALLGAIQELIQASGLSRKDVVGIGMGLPGLIDPKRGIVKFLPNIPNWKNVPLKKIIEDKINIPTWLENDVNLITLGEWKFGAGRGVRNLVCITLGTGVGGGLILDNQLYRGEGFVAGEVGHIPLNETGPDCNCGGFGCFERYVGSRYLQQKAARIFRRKDITFPEVKVLASQGDQRALKFWEDAAVHIGNGLAGVVNLLNPRLIVIGGGVSNNFKFLHKTIEKVIRQRAMMVQARMVKIVRAQLGDDAGIIGALVLNKDASFKG